MPKTKAKTRKVPEGFRKPGSELFFEYRCTEDHGSADAEIWYRSHQRVTVLRCVNEKESGSLSLDERYEAGMPLVYKCLFADDLEWDLCEDELLDSDSEYCRPDPPLKPSAEIIAAARRRFGYRD